MSPIPVPGAAQAATGQPAVASEPAPDELLRLRDFRAEIQRLYDTRGLTRGAVAAALEGCPP